MNRKLRPYMKFFIALIGGAVSAIIIALQALPEGSTLSDITVEGWFIIGSAWLAVAGGVFEGSNTTDFGSAP